MTIALSHGGPTIFKAKSASDTVLVGTARGIARLERRGGGEWTLAGNMLPDLHISVILEEPESGYLFAGAYKDGSLWLSRDGGASWERSDSGLTYTDVYSLAAERIHGRVRLYCGTEPAHLFVSDDLGSYWTELPALRSVPTVDSWSFPGPPHVAHTKHITFDPRRPETMYVSIEVGGLLRSDDAGRTFSDVPGMYEDVHRLVINPKMPDRQYVSGGNGLYATLDGGKTWEHRTTTEDAIGGYPDQLVFSPNDPDLMFIAAAKDPPGSWRETHHAGARISRSRDGGRTWETLTNGLPDRMQGNIEAMCLEEAGGVCAIFAASTAGEVFFSPDNGDSWRLIADDLAPISKGGHYVQLQQPAHA